MKLSKVALIGLLFVAARAQDDAAPAADDSPLVSQYEASTSTEADITTAIQSGSSDDQIITSLKEQGLSVSQAEVALAAAKDNYQSRAYDVATSTQDNEATSTQADSQGEVAAAAAVDAGATEHQADEIADAIDNEGASAASASIDAGLTNSQAAEVITEVVTVVVSAHEAVTCYIHSEDKKPVSTTGKIAGRSHGHVG
ncbi:hypothetical protein DYB28_006066 [Aphanomyces astaci]|uniref:UBA domain-containing protein n=1 Tax=Aphanomyces astaci TaxID=112090 RepID=A0A9X8H256_APHAT|nr:hypothetical protein DYB28_006066 [Aphanomyces astaci]